MKTKVLKNIEERLKSAEPDSVRHKVLTSAKNFKTSWIDLGQALYTVWKDKLYRNWGFEKFDTYTRREIGIRKETALKLLRSYFFLEKEEPDYLKRDLNGGAAAASVPTYESIDALRLASKKSALDKNDYARIKKAIFEDGKDAREIKKDLTALIKEHQELEPEEAREKKRQAVLRRFLGTLQAIQKEIRISKLLSEKTSQEIERVIKRIEMEL